MDHPEAPWQDSPAIHLLSGVLPAEATIHIRQFSLLQMVAYLGPYNPLHQLAVQNLTSKVSASWFAALRKTAIIYELPDPLHILLVPPTKYLIRRWFMIPSQSTGLRR